MAAVTAGSEGRFVLRTHDAAIKTLLTPDHWVLWIN
jgi:hypothetical protein